MYSVTRFRGMISTQPGSTPLASFKVVTIDALDSSISYSCGNDIGNAFIDFISTVMFLYNCFCLLLKKLY